MSWPVRRHWVMNLVWERFITVPATTTVRGIVTSAISARTHEIVSIIAKTNTTVSTDVRSWLIVCWRLCETLSMSLVTRLSNSPRGTRSK